MSESLQHKLDRVRPPRVQITYDVETGGALLKKEEPLPKVRDRKFVEIDRDNFNEVMEANTPRLAFAVDNKLVDDDSKLQVELRFNEIDDFDPVSVLKQVGPLAKLFEARQRLSDLMTKLDGNDDLDTLLKDVIENSDGQKEIKAEIDASKGDDEGEE